MWSSLLNFRPPKARGPPTQLRWQPSTQHIPLLRISASLTTKSHESLGVTVGAADAQEAVLQPAALQIVFEFALHMRRQRALTRRQMRYERRVVGFNQLIQQRLLGAVASIFPRTRTRTPGDGVLAGQ